MSSVCCVHIHGRRADCSSRVFTHIWCLHTCGWRWSGPCPRVPTRCARPSGTGPHPASSDAPSSLSATLLQMTLPLWLQWAIKNIQLSWSAVIIFAVTLSLLLPILKYYSPHLLIHAYIILGVFQINMLLSFSTIRKFILTKYSQLPK